MVTPPPTNLGILEPSRKRLRPGDVFAMEIPAGSYRFGRVVATDALVGPFPNCVLIYVFGAESKSKEPPDPAVLRPENLLVPPLMTNLLPWSRGYFETLENRTLQPGEVLDRHCFAHDNGRYYDEYNNELPGPLPPVGQRVLHSFRTIDDEISKAIGIPLAPGE